MKRLIIIGLMVFGLSQVVMAEWVNGYFRSNGTYVSGYFRSESNSTIYDNYSYNTPKVKSSIVYKAEPVYIYQPIKVRNYLWNSK